MLVIVANRWDQSARTLAARWQSCNARVLTPRDLSRVGWRQRLGQPASCTVVVDEQVIPQSQITGVLMRLPCVFQEELTNVAPEDRPYVVSEMSAFLTFWLTSLTCPVINCPTPGCMTGPAWRPEQWAQLAAQASFPIDSAHRYATPDQGATTSLTVVGDQCFGNADPSLHAPARKLAVLAGVTLLTVRFFASCYDGVDLLPDLTEDSISQAVLQIFEHSMGAHG